MEQRDYLMKQFEQLGIVLAALLGFKTSGEFKRALEEINDAYDRIPGFEHTLLEKNDPQEFLTGILKSDQISFEKLNLIGNFVYEEGEFLNLSGSHDIALDRYHKALVIFNHLDSNEKIYSLERVAKILRIKEILRKKFEN